MHWPHHERFPPEQHEHRHRRLIRRGQIRKYLIWRDFDTARQHIGNRHHAQRPVRQWEREHCLLRRRSRFEAYPIEQHTATGSGMNIIGDDREKKMDVREVLIGQAQKGEVETHFGPLDRDADERGRVQCDEKLHLKASRIRRWRDGVETHSRRAAQVVSDTPWVDSVVLGLLKIDAGKRARRLCVKSDRYDCAAIRVDPVGIGRTS